MRREEKTGPLPHTRPEDLDNNWPRGPFCHHPAALGAHTESAASRLKTSSAVEGQAPVTVVMQEKGKEAVCKGAVRVANHETWAG